MLIQRRAEFIGTFRWIEIKLMEMLAGWVASTPEMEIKVLFGRHVWECAQHADALGKRTFELRAPLHSSLEPLPGYRELVEQTAKLTDSAERVTGFYEILLPGLIAKYQGFLEWTDPLMDEPSVRVVRDILASIGRVQQECADLRRELPILQGLGDSPETPSGVDTFEEFVQHSAPPRVAGSAIA